MKKVDFNKGWLLQKNGSAKTQEVNLPHDAMLAEERNKDVLTGGASAYFDGGKYYYRKKLVLPEEWRNKTMILSCEGVYQNAQVSVNNQVITKWPYGYSGFYVDMTEHLSQTDENIIEIIADNEKVPNSRWYSGGGVYREVNLLIAGQSYIKPEGVRVTTTGNGQVQVLTDIVGEGDVEVEILDGMKAVASGTGRKLDLIIKDPVLWDEENPHLYTCKVMLKEKEQKIDEETIRFGIRTLAWGGKGFFVNGKETLLRGACIHHDNGLLGAKAFDRAEERKIELLKAAGFNALRLSHNPPSTALLNACDRLGMLVIDEAFDMWRQGHYKDDYGQYFDKLWKEDLYSMVARDRNHPCVIMWSIGNEIKNKETTEVVEVCRELTGFVKALDTTRPVTAGVNSIVDATDDFLLPLDVCGYNYCLNRYELDAKRHPDRIIYASESYASQAYDYWKGVENHSWVIGDFIWTAFDYIGEASIGWCGYPLDKRIFPWNHANCGDLNLSGERRPQSYLRETLWSEAPVSHIVVTPPVPSFPLNPDKAEWSVWDFPDVVDHWNFPGYEGKKMTVSVYSNCEQVELFLNGESLGKQENTADKKNTLVWEVPYVHGILKAVSYNKGNEVGTAALESAGKVEKIRLSADRTEIVADGNDLSYITLELVDSKGIRNQLAEELVEFFIEGDATIEGVGNANPMSVEGFVASSRKTWRGSNLLVVRSGKTSGKVIVTAKVQGLPVANIIINQRSK